MNFFDVIEQFEILPFIKEIKNNPFDFFENFLINIFIILFFYWLLSNKKDSAFNLFTRFFLHTIKTYFNTKFNSNLFSLPCLIFLYLLMLFIFWNNITGMIPDTFTLTSLILLPAQLSFMFFIASFFIGIEQNKLNFFFSFIPAKIPLYIVWLLFIIELISYFMRVLSLAIRLFINLLAGHVLLKIFSGIVFICISVFSEMLIFVIFFKLLVVAFIVLEYIACLLQALVFSTLIAIYLNQVFNL